MRKNKTKTLDFGNKMFFSILFVCATVIAAIVVFSITQSHPPTEITPQGAGSSLDADLVDGLQASDLQAQGGGSGGSGWQCAVACSTSTSLACPNPPQDYTIVFDGGRSFRHPGCSYADTTIYGRTCCYALGATATASIGSYKSIGSSNTIFWTGNFGCAKIGGECVTTFYTDGTQINCDQNVLAFDTYSICNMANGYEGASLQFYSLASTATIYSTGDHMCAKLGDKGLKCVRVYTPGSAGTPGTQKLCDWPSTSSELGAALCEPWS